MDNSKCLIGIVTISDRASRGEYEDLSGKEIEKWLNKAITTKWKGLKRLVADEQPVIESVLLELVKEGCSLILTTGGTGPAKRDVTVEATENVCQKILPGFGELMRSHSLKYVPTAILSRQTAGILDQCLIVNLPGSPRSICETLEAVFPAMPYCIDLIEGAWIETNEEFCKSFRPKK